MAQDNLATIQAALKAVGDTSDDEGLEPLQNDKIIRDALEAVSKPVKVIKPPDKTAADFLSGGYPSIREGAARGAGTAAGELGLATQALMFLPSGIAYLAGLPFGTDNASAAQRATVNLLNPTTDWSGKPLGAESDFGQAAQRPSDWLSRAIEGTASAGGDILSRATDPNAPVNNANFQSRFGISLPQGKPLTTSQEAQHEAVTRSTGEAVTNALTALAGLELGGEAVKPGGRPADVPRVSKPQVEPEVTAPPQSNDFQARMQEAAPKRPTPEAPAPAKVQSDMAALEAPYRYRPEKDAATVLPKLPKYLSGAKPKMGEQKLEFASDLDRAAYIVANPRTSSARHADYLEWLHKALGTPDEGAALLLAKRSKEATVASVKAGQPHIQPYLRPKQGESTIVPEEPTPQAQEATPPVTNDHLAELDKRLDGGPAVRTPLSSQTRGLFQTNNLRIQEGDSQPLEYEQPVRDVWPNQDYATVNQYGEKVYAPQKQGGGGGSPLNVHLQPEQIQELRSALSRLGLHPSHMRDIAEMLSIARWVAEQARTTRNGPYVHIRNMVMDPDVSPEVRGGRLRDLLNNSDNYALTIRHPEYKLPKDFEKVCV